MQNLATGQVAGVTMVDGGLIELRCTATVGDTLEVDVFVPTGVEPYFAVVPPRRPPSVVRTNPPKGKTDVPLNTQIIIVFSDPVDPATFAGAIQLLNGNAVVPGSVTLSASGFVANFVPGSTLSARTSYQLVVDTSLRNLRGEAPDFGRACSVYRRCRACSAQRRSTFPRSPVRFRSGSPYWFTCVREGCSRAISSPTTGHRPFHLH